jgi:hypothetical protein
MEFPDSLTPFLGVSELGKLENIRIRPRQSRMLGKSASSIITERHLPSTFAHVIFQITEFYRCNGTQSELYG